MLAYLCTILILGLTVNWSAPASTGDPRATYSRASAAIADGELPLAIELLSELTHQPDVTSPITMVAAFHLAECYLLTNQPAQSLKVLQQWARPIATDPAAARLQPNLPVQLISLVTDTCRALEPTDSTVASLQSFVEAIAAESEVNALVESTLPIDRVRQVAAEELTRRLLRLHRFADALALLKTHGNPRLASEERLSDLPLTETHIQLAWAHHDLQSGRAALAVERLRNMLDTLKLASEQQTGVRFALSEAYIADNQPSLALEQLHELAGPIATEMIPETETATETATEAKTETEAISDPLAMQGSMSWRASVALRRSELLVRLRRTHEAVPVLRQAKERFPDFAQRHEFDYLLARCAIADVHFDEARQHLRDVVEAPSAAGTEAVLKARWMIGETHLLQREHQPALEAYQTVIAFAGQSPWRVRALVQAGKCFELLDQPEHAVEQYAAALQAASLEDESLLTVRLEAKERLEIVRTTLSATRNRKGPVKR